MMAMMNAGIELLQFCLHHKEYHCAGKILASFAVAAMIADNMKEREEGLTAFNEWMKKVPLQVLENVVLDCDIAPIAMACKLQLQVRMRYN